VLTATNNRDRAPACSGGGYDGVSTADLTKAIGITRQPLSRIRHEADSLYRGLRRYQGMGIGADEIADAPTSLEATRRAGERAASQPRRRTGRRDAQLSSGMLMTSPDNGSLAAGLRADRAALPNRSGTTDRRDIDAGLLQMSVDAVALARFYASVLPKASPMQAIDGTTPGRTPPRLWKI